MTAVAKKPEVAPVKVPRPIQTYYFGLRAADHDWSTISHSTTLQRAVRAAVWQIVQRRFYRATIHNEAGVIVARVFRRRNSIVCIGV